eukprot:198397-Prymnesium_polylepis.3
MRVRRTCARSQYDAVGRRGADSDQASAWSVCRVRRASTEPLRCPIRRTPVSTALAVLLIAGTSLVSTGEPTSFTNLGFKPLWRSRFERRTLSSSGTSPRKRIVTPSKNASDAAVAAPRPGAVSVARGVAMASLHAMVGTR